MAEDRIADEDRPYVRVGAYALCVSERDRLLLARLAGGVRGAGRWTLPGGGLDWGERPEDGVLRELEEETGLRATDLGGVVGVYSTALPRRPEYRAAVHAISIVYRVCGLVGELRPEPAGSTDACAWFTKEEAKALPLTDVVEFAIPFAWPETAPTGVPTTNPLPVRAGTDPRAIRPAAEG